MDLEKLFKYPFEDKQWLVKMIVGAVLLVIPIANFIAVGYAMESMRRGLKGESDLPEWENWGQKFIDGIIVFLIILIYGIIPGLILMAGAGGLVWGIISGQAGSMVAAGGGMMLALLIGGILGLLVAVILPMALANYLTQGNFSAAFSFGAILNRIQSVPGNYFIAILLYIAASVVIGIVWAIPLLGWIIGLLGSFYLMVIFFNLFGLIYTESKQTPATLP